MNCAAFVAEEGRLLRAEETKVRTRLIDGQKEH